MGDVGGRQNRTRAKAGVFAHAAQRLRRPAGAAAVILFLTLPLVLPLATQAATRVGTDFTLDLRVNGSDIWQEDTITIDPKEGLRVDITIVDVNREVMLESLSTVVTFAGQPVARLREDLNSFRIAEGGQHRDTIVFSAEGDGRIGFLREITGVFRATVTLNYVASGQAKSWSVTKQLKISGNPMATTAGKAAAAVAGGAVVAAAVLVKSLVAPGVAAGASIAGGAIAKSGSGLQDFISGRLEPTARGRVMANIVKAARSRATKDRCPLCETHFKHGHCHTCKKTTKQVRNEYAEKVATFAVAGAQLIANGEVTTPDDLGSQLDISDRLAKDVFATLGKTKLVKLRGIGRGILLKATVMGITTGLSTVLWVTVGGLTALDTWALAAILAGSIVVPIVIAKSLQAKARRQLKATA